MIRHRFEAVGSVRLIAIAMAHSGRCQCPHQLRPRPVSVPLSCGFGTISDSLTILPCKPPSKPARLSCLIYIHDEQSPGLRPLGGASRWWLHHSLAALERTLSASASAFDPSRPAPTVPSVNWKTSTPPGPSGTDGILQLKSPSIPMSTQDCAPGVAGRKFQRVAAVRTEGGEEQGGDR